MPSTLTTTILALFSAIISSYITAHLTRKNQIHNMIYDKRYTLYCEFCEKMELILSDKKVIFQQSYIEIFCEYKPKLKLLTSDETYSDFRELFNFISQKYKAYRLFLSQESPVGTIDDDGTVYPDELEVEEFNEKDRIYQNTNAPTINELNPYIEPLYKSMRKDLGSKLR